MVNKSAKEPTDCNGDTAEDGKTDVFDLRLPVMFRRRRSCIMEEKKSVCHVLVCKNQYHTIPLPVMCFLQKICLLSSLFLPCEVLSLPYNHFYASSLTEMWCNYQGNLQSSSFMIEMPRTQSRSPQVQLNKRWKINITFAVQQNHKYRERKLMDNLWTNLFG